MELTISTPRLAAARILPRTPRAFYRTAINAFFFVMGMVFASWAVRIPDIKAALQMSDAALGSVLLAAPLGEMLSIAPTAWLIGRFRSRRVIMLGLMLMPCALLSLALAGSPHWLAAALLGFGFANNMLNISLNAQAVGVETLYGRSIMATFHGMWSLGGVAGCIIGSIVAPLGVAPLPHFAAILVITLATLGCLRTWTMPREVRIGAAAPESGKRSFRPDLYLTLLGCIALGSGIGWVVYLVSVAGGHGKAFGMLASSLVIAICSEVPARLIKTPVILLLVPMLIPEIPGGDLYYTMYSLIEGDSAKFASLLQLVLAEAGAIALGIILASYAAGLINNIYRHVRPCAHSPHK